MGIGNPKIDIHRHRHLLSLYCPGLKQPKESCHPPKQPPGLRSLLLNLRQRKPPKRRSRSSPRFCAGLKSRSQTNPFPCERSQALRSRRKTKPMPLADQARLLPRGKLCCHYLASNRVHQVRRRLGHLTFKRRRRNHLQLPPLSARCPRLTRQVADRFLEIWNPQTMNLTVPLGTELRRPETRHFCWDFWRGLPRGTSSYSCMIHLKL